MSDTDCKPVVFDLDDLCDAWDPWDEIHALKNKWPSLKVTLFAIPGRCSDELLARYAVLDWVELGVHGYHHAPGECAVWGPEETKAKIDEVGAVWPGVKLFKAPGWMANEHVYEVLSQEGLTVADNIEQLWRWSHTPGLRYTYNARDDLKSIHGHTWDTMGNGPSDWGKLFEDVSKDAEFKFVSEVVREDRQGYEWLSGTDVKSAANKVCEPFVDLFEVVKTPTERNKFWAWWGPWKKLRQYGHEDDILFCHHFVENTESMAVLEFAVKSGLKLVVPCELTKRIVENLGADRMWKIPYFVPTAEIRPKASRFRVGIIGNANATYKNWDTIREVCKLKKMELVDWADDEIQWDRDKESFYEQIAVVVNLSDVEGGPLPPMEALVRGRFAISTRVGMMPEIESEGLILTDKDDLAKALDKAEELWTAQEDPVNMLPEWISNRSRVVDAMRAVCEA